MYLILLCCQIRSLVWVGKAAAAVVAKAEITSNDDETFSGPSCAVCKGLSRPRVSKM